MASGNACWRAIKEYDFDDAYFNDVGSSNDCEDNDDDWSSNAKKKQSLI